MKLIFLVFLVISFFLFSFPQSQSSKLKVISTEEEYLKTVLSDSNKVLVDLELYIPDIKLDIRYATPNNFTKKILYSKPKAYLRLPVAKAIKKIQLELNKFGYEVKIFDAYRPYTVTVDMWNYVKDPKFVAPPNKGSRHNRGCAVDLTILDVKTGQELTMPTEFDNFTRKAHHNYNNLSKEVLKNRALLRKVMENHGFKITTSEWWHYDFIGYTKYELLNLSFEQLENIKR